MLYPRVSILSTERTGASIFYRDVYGNRNRILEKISMAEPENVVEVTNELQNHFFMYPQPIMDNMAFASFCIKIAKQDSFIIKNNSLPLYNEIAKLFYTLAGGVYKATETGILFKPQNSEKNYPIELASSSVRSLVMLNYYIFNKARKGDILMIDEPELNLHPNNQILMGRLLALLVNAGVKVFVTTHSDYIVRELSNCIMLNNLNNEQITKLSKKSIYTKEYKLEASKVKAYIAENVSGKNTLNPVNIDAIRGIFMKTFDSPIDTQNENQSLIFEEIVKGLDNDK